MRHLGRRAVVAGGLAVPAVLLSPGRACAAPGLERASRKEIAMQLVSSAENSSLDWRAQYRYLQDIGDGRGYTGGIIGFCSGTGDMLEVVRLYTRRQPDNPLRRFVPALREVDGTDSHEGLGRPFVRAWQEAAGDAAFRRAQDDERDRVYFDPAVRRGKGDGLRTLGQFVYYDAFVMHGPGSTEESFGGIRRAAREQADTPADGGDETTYLRAFFAARRRVMRLEAAHEDTSRIDTAQARFLRERNFDLAPPLVWHVYGDRYRIGADAGRGGRAGARLESTEPGRVPREAMDVTRSRDGRGGPPRPPS